MLVLIGRSCTGKDTIKNILVKEYGMERTVTCTSRPPRDGEIDGVDYHFMKSGYFTEVHDLFAETTGYQVASGETWLYGSLKKDYKDSDNKVIILNPDGLKAVRQKGIPIFAVEISSPDNIIKGRQLHRGDDPEEAARRFDQDILDFVSIDKYTDTCVINWGEDGPERCARNIYDLYQHWLAKRGEGDVEDNVRRD